MYAGQVVYHSLQCISAWNVLVRNNKGLPPINAASSNIVEERAMATTVRTAKQLTVIAVPWQSPPFSGAWTRTVMTMTTTLVGTLCAQCCNHDRRNTRRN